jgi:hypothetical protein
MIWTAPPAAAVDWRPAVADAARLLQAAPPAMGRVAALRGPTIVVELAQQARPPAPGSLLLLPPAAPGAGTAILQLSGVQGTSGLTRLLSGPYPARPGLPVYPWHPNQVIIVNPPSPDLQAAAGELGAALAAAGLPHRFAPSFPAPDRLAPTDRPLVITLQPTGSSITVTLQEPGGRVLRSHNLPRGTGAATGSFTAPSPPPAAPPPASTPSFTQASLPQPSAIPRRISLQGAYRRLTFADIDGNGSEELLLLSNSGLEAYRLVGGDLTPIGRYRLPTGDIIPLNLHHGDFNHNGRDELYVTLGRRVIYDEKDDTRLESVVVEFLHGKPHQLGEDYPYYFRVMETREGKRVLLAQEMDDYEQYKLPIRWAGFYDGKLEVKGPYRGGHKVFCLDHFVENPFNPEQILVLDFAGGLGGYHAPSEELLTTADTDFGIYDEIVYPQKLPQIDYEGGYVFKKTATERFAPRRFVLRNRFGRQAFLIRKGRRVRPELLEKGVSLIKGDTSGVDQVVGVQWRANAIVETWKSPEFSRDIIDFGFFRGGGRDTLVLLTRSNTDKYLLEFLH